MSRSNNIKIEGLEKAIKEAASNMSKNLEPTHYCEKCGSNYQWLGSNAEEVYEPEPCKICGGKYLPI